MVALTSVSMPEPEAAEQALAALQQLRARRADTLHLVAEGSGETATITLPQSAFELLMQILAHIAEGNAVSVVPVHADLTTQQAADLLGVSRPFLVSLLEEGKIPFRKIGTHRRVRVSDLLTYQRIDDAERKAAADALTKEAQDLGPDY